MTEPSSRIRVLCVDDHRIVRDGLALIIGREPDMEIVGAALPARRRWNCSGVSSQMSR